MSCEKMVSSHLYPCRTCCLVGDCHHICRGTITLKGDCGRVHYWPTSKGMLHQSQSMIQMWCGKTIQMWQDNTNATKCVLIPQTAMNSGLLL